MNIKKIMIPVIMAACIIGGIIIIISCDEGSSDKKDGRKLILFGTAVAYDGNLGGRAGADAKCDADANKPASVGTVHALISVDSSDTIALMPATYGFSGNIPIVGPDGETVIANNWADLLDGTIDVALGDAGILYNVKGLLWWSGSSDDGTLIGNDCTNWSNNSSGSGEVGVSSATNTEWIIFGSTLCTASRYLLGIGY